MEGKGTTGDEQGLETQCVSSRYVFLIIFFYNYTNDYLDCTYLARRLPPPPKRVQNATMPNVERATRQGKETTGDEPLHLIP